MKNGNVFHYENVIYLWFLFLALWKRKKKNGASYTDRIFNRKIVLIIFHDTPILKFKIQNKSNKKFLIN